MATVGVDMRSEASFTGLVGQLTEDARDLARAEIDLAKARAGAAAGRYKAAAILFAAAGVLALAALIALLVGLIMTLATELHPGWATLIVVGAVLAIAGVLGLMGSRRLAAKD